MVKTLVAGAIGLVLAGATTFGTVSAMAPSSTTPDSAIQGGSPSYADE